MTATFCSVPMEFLIDQQTTRLSSARRPTSDGSHLVPFEHIRMAIGRQPLFPKSEQCALVRRTTRELQSAREFSTGRAYACHDVRMHLRHSARMMGVRMRNQPVVSHE